MLFLNATVHVYTANTVQIITATIQKWCFRKALKLMYNEKEHVRLTNIILKKR